jgi:hypothetical protein
MADSVSLGPKEAAASVLEPRLTAKEASFYIKRLVWGNTYLMFDRRLFHGDLIRGKGDRTGLLKNDQSSVAFSFVRRYFC